MERKLGLLLATTLAMAFVLGWIITSEPGRVQTAEARAAEARQGGQATQLYAGSCAGCHGKFGEGGPNPMGSGDSPPLSAREFLSTHDDWTIRAVIAKGKPSRGMPPWAKESGGPLTEEQIVQLVAFIRNWQTNPPQIPPRAPEPPKAAAAPAPPKAAAAPAPAKAEAAPAPAKAEAPPQPKAEVKPSPPPTEAPKPVPTPRVEAQPAPAKATAGPSPAPAEAPKPPPAAKEEPKAPAPPKEEPKPAPPAPAKEEPKPAPPAPAKEEPKPAPPQPAGASFAGDVLPVLQKSCAACHGALGGWNAGSYASVMSTGEHKPVVVAGDPDGSLLVQKLKGSQSVGQRMPPFGDPLPAETVQKIADWVKAGAKDN